MEPVVEVLQVEDVNNVEDTNVEYLMGVADSSGEFDRSKNGPRKASVMKLDVDNCKLRVEVWSKVQASDCKGFVVFDTASFDHLSRTKWYPLCLAMVVTGRIHISVSKVHPKILANYQQRMVRVFLSSTFTDMNEDREVIMRKVMVPLKHFCYERGVCLTYIDMRWGITKEMGDKALTILTCLREVDNSRPYFVGLLGERYGWHQEVDGRDDGLTKTFEQAEAEYDWIKQFRTKSVTELEIQHGFLLHPSMAKGHTLFFFRDPKYVDTVDPSLLSRFKDTTPYALQQMANLKQRICDRAAIGDCVVENYEKPEHLEDLLLARLMTMIEADFPLLNSSDILLQRQYEHSNYARQRCEAYVPRQRDLDTLNTLTSSDETQLILLTGASGSGKSALLANWLQSTNSPIKRIFAHFVGASLLASDFSSMLIHLFEEINNKSALNGGKAMSIPSGERALTDAIPKFLERASLQGGLTIIFDAVNQLQSQYHDLHWLPVSLPSKVHVVVSCLPEGETLPAAKKRANMKHITVQPLSKDERREIIQKRLSLYGKSIPIELLTQITDHEHAKLPLFLTTILSELCTIGVHSKLGNQVKDLLECKDVPSLFRKVIIRWETNFGKDLVKVVLLLILVSRSGVTEFTIMEISQALPLHLHPLLSAIKQLLVVNQGKFNFCHQYLHTAVKEHYCDRKDHYSVQLELVKYLQTLQFDSDIARDLPWIISQMMQSPACPDSSRVQQQLADLLLNLDNFEVYSSSDYLTCDWVKYWDDLKRLDNKWSMGSLYAKRAAEVASKCRTLQTARTLVQLGKLIEKFTAQAEHASSIVELALPIFVDLQNQEGIASSSHVLGRCCRLLGRLAEGRNLLAEASDTYIKLHGENHPTVADVFDDMGRLLRYHGMVEAGTNAIEKALAIRLELFGEYHSAVADSFCEVGDSLEEQHRSEEARQAYEKAHSIRVVLFGEHHPDVADSICCLARLEESEGNHKQAVEMFNKALHIYTSLFGEGNINALQTLSSLGLALCEMGKHVDGLEKCEKAFALGMETVGEHNPAVTVMQGSLAIALYTQGQHSRGIELQEQVLSKYLKNFGDCSTTVGVASTMLGQWLEAQGRTAEAKDLIDAALQVRVKAFGHDSLPVASILFKQADSLARLEHTEEAIVLWEKVATIIDKLAEEGTRDGSMYVKLGHRFAKYGSVSRAIEIQEKALASRIEMFGEFSSQASTACVSLATLFSKLDKHDLATELHERALQIQSKLHGPEHPTVIDAFNRRSFLLYQQNQTELLEKALAVRLEIYGENHLTVVHALAALGHVLINQDQRPEGKAVLEKAVTICAKLKGEPDRILKNIVRSLANLWVSDDNNKKGDLTQYFASLGLETKVSIGRDNSVTLESNVPEDKDKDSDLNSTLDSASALLRRLRELIQQL